MDYHLTKAASFKQHEKSQQRTKNVYIYIYIYISLCFNRHFPGELGLVSFTGSKDDASGGDNWSYKISKAPVKSPSTNQHPVFIGRMPFLLPNQQCLRILQVNTDGISWYEKSVDPCYMNENISQTWSFFALLFWTYWPEGDGKVSQTNIWCQSILRPHRERCTINFKNWSFQHTLLMSYKLQTLYFGWPSLQLVCSSW